MKIFKTYTLLFVVAFTALQCDKIGADSANNAAANTGTGGSTARFTIVGNYLYTVRKTDLVVYSIADATNPVMKKTVPVGFEIETIYPFKDKLFIGSTSQVYIFSIANPEAPEKLSVAISPTVIRRCDPVVARDTVAYATLRVNQACGGGTQSILAVYNIKDVTRPVQVNFLSLSEPYGLGFADSSLYVATMSGIEVYNIAREYFPIYLKNVRNQDWFYDVIPYGNLLIAWAKDGVVLFDISNKANPVFISKII